MSLDDIDVSVRDTEPAPNANTDELARELEKLAFKNISEESRDPDFWTGWKSGVREAAEYVRTQGAK